MTMPALLRSWPIILLLVAGCTAGVGDGTGGQSGAGDGLGAASATSSAPWLVYDVASRTATPVADLPDLAANPDYRDRLMVFRRLDAGRTAVGQAVGSFARQDDEAAGSAAYGPCWLAVFETTRAQWRRLAGNQPWTALSPAVGGDDDRLPALGLSLDAIAAALAPYGGRLTLPGAAEWEAAARAGTASVWPWGDSHLASVVGLYARTAETGGAAGPAPVGNLAANAWGFHDLLGNAWEPVADGSMRGGSWADALSLARPANRAAIEPGTASESLGLRLAYRP